MTALAERYRRLADHFSTVVNAVPDDRWEAASPCADWKAIDIVEHVAETELEFLRRMAFADGLPAELPAAAVERWVLVREAAQSVLDDPSRADRTYDGFFGPTTVASTIDQFYSMDLCVHTWDLARAAGLSHLEPIDPVEMRTIRAALAGLGEGLRQPGVIGPEAAVPDDADEQTRFLAWLGRRA